VLPITNTLFDEIYLLPPVPADFFLNEPASIIQVFVRRESSPNWVEALPFNNGNCVTPYIFFYDTSGLSIFTCPNDYSLPGKKASVRVVIK
jgi:hypothetical protein